MLYYMNIDTGNVIAREVGDEPYGDLWMEIEESEYQDRLHPLTPSNNGLHSDGACSHPERKLLGGVLYCKVCGEQLD